MSEPTSSLTLAEPLAESENGLGAGPGKPSLGLHRKMLVRGAIRAACALAAGLAVPYVLTDRYYMGLLLNAIILALLALGIGFLARHLGLISLGHTAFFGGSAYAVAIAATHWGWQPLPAALFGFGVGVAIAVAMGSLTVKSSGMGFLMLTLALSQALYQFSIQPVARDVTGAYDGLQVQFASGSTFLGLKVPEMMSAAKFWPVVWVALVATCFVLWLVGRSRFGTLLEGIRENEERMRFSGFTTYAPRLWAFIISGAVASLGGVLFVLNASYVSPETLGFIQAGDGLMAAIIGGLGTLLGPVIGAALFTFAESFLNTGGNIQIYMGAVLVAVLVFMPGGLTGNGKFWKAALKRGRKRGRK